MAGWMRGIVGWMGVEDNSQFGYCYRVLNQENIWTEIKK